MRVVHVRDSCHETSKVSEQPCTRRNIRCWVACEEISWHSDIVRIEQHRSAVVGVVHPVCTLRSGPAWWGWCERNCLFALCLNCAGACRTPSHLMPSFSMNVAVHYKDVVSFWSCAKQHKKLNDRWTEFCEWSMAWNVAKPCHQHSIPLHTNTCGMTMLCNFYGILRCWWIMVNRKLLSSHHLCMMYLLKLIVFHV